MRNGEIAPRFNKQRATNFHELRQPEKHCEPFSKVVEHGLSPYSPGLPTFLARTLQDLRAVDLRPVRHEIQALDA